MTPSSISTSPMLKLRWKLVPSSCASHRQNSTHENADTAAGVSRSLVTESCQISRFSSSGTKYRVLAEMPWYLDPMVVYPKPCRQVYASASWRVGCHDGDQNSPFVSSRR